MAVTQDIVATYRGPARVVGRLLDRGPREDRALMFVMLGCGMTFIAQLPGLARQAHLTGEDLDMLLGSRLLALLFVAPLLLYCIAALSHIVMRGLKGQGSGYASRLALFWALLAASPILLLNGLTAGFVGPGPALNVVGGIWLGCFLWFWIAGLRRAHQGGAI